jgi:hypothetical protein
VSVTADLAAMFAVPELTVPVSLGSGSTRGYLDSGGMMVPLAGTELQRIGTVLHLIKGSLPGLAENVSVTVGAVGAASADGGTTYRITAIEPIEDGLMLACQLGGGR